MAFISRLFVFSVILMILGSQNAHAIAVNCRDLFKTDVRFKSQQLTLETVQELIQSLARLKLDLDLNHLSPSLIYRKLRLDYEAKEAEILSLLEAQQIMTKAQLLSEISREITELQARRSEIKTGNDEEKREKKREEKIAIELSVIDGSKAVFHPIAPGDFEMGEVGSQKHVEITKPFEMMATQTTQVIWKTVVLAAKKRFPGRFDAFNEDPSNFKGDLNPVEQVSYMDIMIWLEALNDLSKADDPIISTLIPGHIKGSIYRLPTEAEWEFVARARGQAKGLYYFGDNEADLKNHAWYSENAVNTTHPVAEKDPLNLDGKEFYDLHGNVWEWTADAYEQTLPGGIDPFNAGNAGSNRVIRGGAWRSNAQNLRTADRSHGTPSDRYGIIGFRLARTAP